jgi:methionyl aminopeptidase
MEKKELESYNKVGKIAQEIRIFAKKLIRPGMLLVDIAKKIEDEIKRLGAEPAFPVNLSIDHVAAHYHPTLEDETKASGLLKVDMGIHVDGFIADTAISLDLTENQKHKELIESAELALKNALFILDKNPTLNDIGKTIQDSIESRGFSPIVNLSGHSIERYEVHAGITIPNYANGNDSLLSDGVYAIEPFATSGEGKIYEGPPGNIYAVTNYKNTRNPTARKILEYVSDKYKSLPFSLREMQEKFGPMARLALRQLEKEGIVHNFHQLIEKSGKPVSQAEHTFIKHGSEILITTKK